MTQAQNPSLKDLQKWMRWAITDPRGVQSALTEAPAAHLLNPERYCAPRLDCRDFIKDSPPITRPDRLSIYAEAYFSRLLESLSADFETVLKVIGENAFTKLTADYLKSHPSVEFNIGEVGRHFELFLIDHEFAKEVLFLPELAKLEWTVIQSFYANDLPLLDLTALSKVPGEAWGEARFILDPSVFLMKMEWPVHELWPAKEAYELEPETSRVLVFRFGGSVRVEALGLVEFKILGWMSENLSLTQICERLGEEQQELPPLMEWFQNWIALGIIRSIQTEGNES